MFIWIMNTFVFSIMKRKINVTFTLSDHSYVGHNPFKLNEKEELIETLSRACPHNWWPKEDELKQYKKDIIEYEENL